MLLSGQEGCTIFAEQNEQFRSPPLHRQRGIFSTFAQAGNEMGEGVAESEK
jgi:hypothetical protein